MRRPADPPDLARWRADTPGCESLVHLNNAGAALQPLPVRQATLGHLELEQEIGSACADPRPLAQHLATLARRLGAAEKETLVRTALAVARAKGPLRDAQRARLGELAGALGMSSAHLLGVLAESGD